MWLQWLLPFSLAALLVVALVAFVRHQTNDVPQIANVTNRNAIVEQNREDTIIVRQQQAPHVSKLATGVSAADGMRAAVDRYMAYRVSHGSMAGPLKATVCHATGATNASGARQVLKCEVTAADVTYPFDGVASAGVITYCQRVAPPIPSMNVPVSKRCT